ncbi:MAG: PorT family protein [Bacteroidales bacterium]|nr:PorT family protein [Bacteroidales bacterium]
MKKIITTTLVIALSLGVFAQQNQRFSFGARVGLGIGLSQPKYFMDFANQMPFFPDHTITNFAHHSEVNFNIALYGNFAFGNYFSLQPELNFMLYQGYDMRMTIFSNTTFALPTTFNADLSYYSLDIPLLAKVDFLGSRSASFGLLAGPHLSIPLGRAEFYREIWGAEIEDYFPIDNFAVFGLTAGLFCRIPVGPGRIVGDFRFIHDFQSLKATTVANNQFEILRRSALIFSLGYEISF